MPELRPINAAFDRWDDLLELILQSFAYMDPIIDPPSSAKRLTAPLLKDKAAQELGFVVTDGGKLLGCMFCKPEPDSLYIGKFAVHPQAQGRGIGRQLLMAAEEEARSRGLGNLRLETRIELTGNHRRFAGWGFVRTAEKSHPGFERITFIEMRKRLDG
ncbi:GNAT family N-acetyltransferase [Rhizobium sp. RU36D]|uniref:GNAT family N-acetyltransferase n=1 Tax=Rhizobium sp. RU36D TaxID=1907415 RepID=UPI0009D8C1FE|nr:GNAT family N-acetyltransferase [Rhizobium sp. RU36D]SMD17325.1 Acetyltransferase (GNAT) family protein [Rhizobium sp. RU36D]